MNNQINNLFQKSINLDQIKKLDKKQLEQVLKINLLHFYYMGYKKKIHLVQKL